MPRTISQCRRTPCNHPARYPRHRHLVDVGTVGLHLPPAAEASHAQPLLLLLQSLHLHQHRHVPRHAPAHSHSHSHSHSHPGPSPRPRPRPRHQGRDAPARHPPHQAHSRDRRLGHPWRQRGLWLRGQGDQGVRRRQGRRAGRLRHGGCEGTQCPRRGWPRWRLLAWSVCM